MCSGGGGGVDHLGLLYYGGAYFGTNRLCMSDYQKGVPGGNKGKDGRLVALCMLSW